jgi:hypothetical protein
MKFMRQSVFSRDLAAEAAKHFKGSPEERMANALALGRDLFEMYARTLAPTVTRAEAGERVRLTTHAGRRPSRVMDLPRG